MIPSPHRRSTNLILLILPGALSVTEFDKQPEGRGRKRQTSGYYGYIADLPLDSALGEAGLGAELGPSHTHPCPAEGAINCGSFCSSKNVSQNKSFALSDIDLHQNLSQEGPGLTQPVPSFRQYQRRIQLASQATYPEGDCSRHKTLLRKIQLPWVNIYIAVHTLWLKSILTLSQPKVPTHA